jgi:hypothetical protein
VPLLHGQHDPFLARAQLPIGVVELADVDVPFALELGQFDESVLPQIPRIVVIVAAAFPLNLRLLGWSDWTPLRKKITKVRLWLFDSRTRIRTSSGPESESDVSSFLECLFFGIFYTLYTRFNEQIERNNYTKQILKSATNFEISRLARAATTLKLLF